MSGRNAVEHPPKEVTAEDQIEAIGVTAHRKTLYHFLAFIAGKRLNQTFETLNNSHHNYATTAACSTTGDLLAGTLSSTRFTPLVEVSYPPRSSRIGCVNEGVDKPSSDKSYRDKSAVHLAIFVSGSSCGKRSRITLRISPLRGILRINAVKNCSSPCPIFSSIRRILSRCS